MILEILGGVDRLVDEELDGQHLFGEMAIGFGNCNSKYSQGQTKYYIMNEKLAEYNDFQLSANDFESTFGVSTNYKQSIKKWNPSFNQLEWIRLSEQNQAEI